MSKPIVWSEEENPVSLDSELNIPPNVTLNITWMFGDVKSWRYTKSSNYSLYVRVPFKGDIPIQGTATEVVEKLQSIQDEFLKEWMEPLKIYAVDWGWAGSIVVVAESKEEAKKIIESVDNLYNERDTIEEHEIKGFVFNNLGDR